MAQGVTATLAGLHSGDRGLLVELQIAWPEHLSSQRSRIHQVYVVENGVITEIQGYEDRSSAEQAAGMRTR